MDEAAARLGLHPGQKAADAMAVVPELTMADADPEGDRAALEALAEWCVRFSPAVATDPPDGLLLDITGVAHLWGGEAAMAQDLLARLAANCVFARAAVADTAGAAWALARYGSSPSGGSTPEGREGGSRPRRPGRGPPSPQGKHIIASPSEQASLLADLPTQALRLDEVAAAQLPRLGLTRIGRLMALPRAQLTRRFGPGLLTRLDQALGRAEEALVFRRPATPWFARLAFAEPISTPEDLARSAADVAARLCARLEIEGKGARRFEIVFHRLDGQAHPVRIGLSLPGRDPVRIARLIAPKLETVDPGFGIEVVTMTAEAVEATSPRQRRLDAGHEVSVEEGLAPLVDRLAGRLGEERVFRAQPFESHVPERSVARRPPLAPASGGWDPERPRPIRLFRRPEPIEVMALLPDDPPVRFRWRGRLHKVRAAEGPERIAEEWWKKPVGEVGPSHVRDYYRVEDEAGGRFWVFRAGVRWWLHGLFG